jgi:rRNA maturation RNase YbeY
MSISFQTFDVKDPIAGKKKTIKIWIQHIVDEHRKKTGNLSYIFCSNKKLREINIQYLNHDYDTDIITFPYNEENTINGDIMISVEQVKLNAEAYKAHFFDELLRVMAHGVLHLLGYNDHTKQEIAQMRKAEDKAIEQYYKLTAPDNTSKP